jgi:hypothetical protein
MKQATSRGREFKMAEPIAAYPYETRLNLLHGPLETVDVKALADACEY